MEYDNPFELLRSEHLDSAAKFHSMFGPQMVEVLSRQKDSLWDTLQVLRSAPGGGKTSLLRLFTIESLSSIFLSKRVSEYISLASLAQDIGVLGSDGPNILGVRISCSSNYSQIEDLEFDNLQKDAIFLTLLNVRVIMTILQAACFACSTEMDMLSLNTDNNHFLGIFNSRDAKSIYEIACRIENEINKTIDSLSNETRFSLPLIRDLLVWKVFKSDTITFHDKALNKRVLVMLDDVQDLASRQRELLIKLLQEDYPTSRWIAERYQGLDPGNIIKMGTNQGREMNIHMLEEWNQSNKAKFFRGLGEIADKRVRQSRIIDVAAFELLLESPEHELKYIEKCKEAVDKIQERIKKNEIEKRFNGWINDVSNQHVNLMDEAISWKALEILIERKKKRDFTLFPDEELPKEEFDKMDSSSLRNAAKLVVCKEFGIPYYCGIDNLKILSSGNVEQFLRLCGLQFSELVATATLKKSNHPIISASRQERIIRELAKNRIDEIPTRITNGNKVKNLVLNFVYLAQSKTYESTAPYAPGVTGFAISINDRDKLCDERFLSDNPQYAILANVLRDAIAYHIFEFKPKVFCKKQEWMVLYLNRLFCAHYWLPLEYGGFKEQKLNTLLAWIQSPPQVGVTKKGLFDGL